ncbi:hypothetical protein QK908_00175 [Lactococcus cremoris]
MLDKKFQWNKVPAIGLLFWLTKLISTGQGESLSDFSSKLFGQQNQMLGAVFPVAWSLILFGIFLFLQLKSEKTTSFLLAISCFARCFWDNSS